MKEPTEGILCGVPQPTDHGFHGHTNLTTNLTATMASHQIGRQIRQALRKLLQLRASPARMSQKSSLKLTMECLSNELPLDQWELVG